jgi:hypothetical protein
MSTNDRRHPARVPSPVGFFAPPALQTRGIHIPVQPTNLSFRRGRQAAPRRGVPHPLCSASAVSHNCDGLLLLESCGVFQPLTPMGFVLPASRRFVPGPDQPEGSPRLTRGWATEWKTPGRSRQSPAEADHRLKTTAPAAEAASPASVLRARCPKTTCSSSTCVNHRSTASPVRVTPFRSL